MNLWNKTGISGRLAIGFGLQLLLAALIAAVAYIETQRIADEFDDVSDNFVPKIQMLAEYETELNEMARASRNLLLMTDVAELQKQRQDIASSREITKKMGVQLDSTVTSTQGKQLLAAMHKTGDRFEAETDAFLALEAKRDLEGALAHLMSKLRPVQLDYITALDALTDLQKSLLDTAGKEVDGVIKETTVLLVLSLGFTLVVGCILAITITRSIVTPLQQGVALANSVLAGDLSTNVQAEGRSETSQLLRALNEMSSTLSGVIGQVRGNADAVATASAQIAQGTQDLSSRTEQQASSLEETAASMEELTSTVRNNADNSRQANQLAGLASEVAQQGGQVVSEVVDTMREINDSSKRISDIIGVIDSIAFQTNILALNAAVEAARAGEQGRGFAVVASEVRSLAQRSAEAAKEIKSLIGASVEKVERGTVLVDRAGQTMHNVVQSIKKVTDLVGEISTASIEQNEGMNQVGQAVSQMDQVTQQNAALVEESAAAAESLKTQAKHLLQSVSHFKVAGEPPRESRRLLGLTQSTNRAH